MAAMLVKDEYKTNENGSTGKQWFTFCLLQMTSVILHELQVPQVPSSVSCNTFHSGPTYTAQLSTLSGLYAEV